MKNTNTETPVTDGDGVTTPFPADYAPPADTPREPSPYRRAAANRAAFWTILAIVVIVAVGLSV